MASELSVAFVSSYPPRACGIATFTRDLSEAVAQSNRAIVPRIAALTEEGALYRYPSPVRWVINQCDVESWWDVAQQINKSRVSMVSIQHEFGLFGQFEKDGRFIDYLPRFLEHIKKPVVITLHTVMPHPRPDIREAVRTLHDHSVAVVTMINMAGLILEQEYGLDPAKLYTIPHGVPAVRKANPEAMKRAMQLDGRTIVSTFGLLNSGKGIQYVIRALPEVVKKHPDVLYLVIGETHPEIRRREGEKYRNSLIELTKKLHMENHVRFVNQYLSQNDLVRYLQATDIYITPYLDRYQITSGTLAYALGCGKAVISTPYLYAAEALSEGRGLLAEFQNPRSFARCISMLLEQPALRQHCEENALHYGKPMGWPSVGARYADLFRTIVNANHKESTIIDIKTGLPAMETTRTALPPLLAASAR